MLQGVPLAFVLTFLMVSCDLQPEEFCFDQDGNECPEEAPEEEVVDDGSLHVSAVYLSSQSVVINGAPASLSTANGLYGVGFIFHLVDEDKWRGEDDSENACLVIHLLSVEVMSFDEA